jgi:hypothetical protein
VVKSLKWDLKSRNSQLATSSALAALLILAEAATTADAGYVSYQNNASRNLTESYSRKNNIALLV